MFTINKRLGLSSGLIAAMLAVCSCTQKDLNPFVALDPLGAPYALLWVAHRTLIDEMKGFDTQERKREAKPREDGPFTDHWPNGNKKAAGSYKGKKLDGLYTTYYETGQKKSEVTYSSGERNGPHTSWHENGQKSLEGVFRNGKSHGSTKSYYKNGRISYLASGNPDGTNITWHKNGQKKRVSTYKKGELISRTIWHENGQKAVEKKFKDGELTSELVSAKYWNSKGKEVETEKEAVK